MRAACAAWKRTHGDGTPALTTFSPGWEIFVATRRRQSGRRTRTRGTGVLTHAGGLPRAIAVHVTPEQTFNRQTSSEQIPLFLHWRQGDQGERRPLRILQ